MFITHTQKRMGTSFLWKWLSKTASQKRGGASDVSARLFLCPAKRKKEEEGITVPPLCITDEGWRDQREQLGRRAKRKSESQFADERSGIWASDLIRGQSQFSDPGEINKERKLNRKCCAPRFTCHCFKVVCGEASGETQGGLSKKCDGGIFLFLF